MPARRVTQTIGPLGPMPPVVIPAADLAKFGAKWTALGRRLSRTPPESSSQLGALIDRTLGAALATMLGNIPLVTAKGNRLLPPDGTPNCVEVGPVTVVGAVRVQDYDVGYRPDGVRFVADSKTLNDRKSVGKNGWNMINDLATEATTIHLRFPAAVVAFIVAFPEPTIESARRLVFIETLERMTGRFLPDETPHRAEAIAFVLWDPATGQINPNEPPPESPLRIERLHTQIERAYVARYKGDPPHRKR
jgi:hypothetical protein